MMRNPPSRNRERHGADAPCGGFTLVEIMVVVLIIGVLVAIAIPVFNVARERSTQRTCLGSQRVIAGAVQTWAASRDNEDVADLEGVIDASHPLIGTNIFRGPPRCPGAPPPADPENPTAAEGAYSLTDTGRVEPCPFGSPAHGSVYDQ